MRKAEFKFDLDQRVINQFGGEGMVETLAVDDGGVKYWGANRDRPRRLV